MRDEKKLFVLNDHVALTSVGLTGAADHIIKEIESRGFPNSLPFNELVSNCEDIIWNFYKRNKERICEATDDEDEYWGVQLITSNRIVDIGPSGFSQEEQHYLCEGSGKLYGEYILRQRYKETLSEEECKELAAYVVLQTSRIDPSVGGPITIAIVNKNGLKHVSREETDEIVEKITEIPIERELEVQNIVDEIVQERRWINASFRNKFKVDLFGQNEVAISQIQRSAKTEDDFTNRISALSTLIDNMNFPKFTDVDGSINKLETFAKTNLPQLTSECISNLREIHALRSKKMPIHKDDPKIIQIILNWEFKIPPNWTNLWVKALIKYRDSLKLLKKASM